VGLVLLGRTTLGMVKVKVSPGTRAEEKMLPTERTLFETLQDGLVKILEPEAEQTIEAPLEIPNSLGKIILSPPLGLIGFFT